MPTLTTTAGDLVKALRDITAVAKKGDLPILSNVIITADKRVSFTASNMVQEISKFVDMEASGKFSTSVDATKLASIAGALESGQQVVMDIGADNVTVKSGRSRYQFQTLPVDTFPKIPREKGVSLEIGDAFRAALDGVYHAICVSEVMWNLQGVAMHVNAGNIELFATDSNRMAIFGIGAGAVPDIIIPTAAIDLIMKVDDSTLIDMTIGEKTVTFVYGSTTLITKVIDAKVQAYERLLGWEPAITLSLPRAASIAALGRLMIVADDKDRSIVIETGDGGIATISNSSGDETILLTDTDAVMPVRIGFKAQFLREAFAALSGETVEIRIANPNSPVIIVAPENPDATLICGTFRV